MSNPPLSDGFVCYYRLGQFFSGNCYVLEYAYKPKNKVERLLYFWIGSLSSHIDQGTASKLVEEKKAFLGLNRPVIRMEQGKESQHFCKMFKCQMVVRLGKIYRLVCRDLLSFIVHEQEVKTW